MIGIENYDSQPNVKFTRKDVLIIKEYFVRILGVPAENIISLIDSEAITARIEGYLKKYILANVEIFPTGFRQCTGGYFRCL